MQDLKNNAQNNRQGGGEKNTPHPFDLELRRVLAEAEIQPEDELMDKMFARLEKTEESTAGKQSGFIHAKKQPALARVLKLGTKWSYAAAAVIILIALAIGIKETGKKNTVILPPEGLIALNPSGNPAIAGQKGESAPVSRDNIKGVKTGTPNAAATAQAKLNGPATDNEKAMASKATTPKADNLNRSAEKNADLAKGTLKNVPGTAVATVKATKRPANQTNSATAAFNDKSLTTGLLPGKTQKIEAEKAGAKTEGQLAETKKELATALNAAVKAPEQLTQPVITSSIDVESITAKDYNQTVLSDQKAAGHRHRKKSGGFFRGLVQKITNGARSISEDVVTQDEDKTVINIGIVAITAYK